MQTTLRDTAAEFSQMRGALQNASALPVVTASPASRARVDALNKRAAAIQGTIESVGRMIDGARRWFSDTFGTDVQQTVPLANPAINGSIQTSIATMKYFLRDAKAELDRIIARQKQFESLPDEKKKSALSEFSAESVAVAAPNIPKKWLVIGALAVGALIWWRGGEQ